MKLEGIGIPPVRPTHPDVPRHAPVTGPSLATFSYVIRSPHDMAHFGIIEAHAWPNPKPVPAGASFDDAVAAAKLLTAESRYDDGIHNMPINQCVGVLQAVDGSYSIAPLGGDHRERTGPLYVDGRFFDLATLSLQVVRNTSDLVAVVGSERVLDLRETGTAAVIVPAEH